MIQDEGPGIDDERIATMFDVFGELFKTQSMKLVKHNSIGVGLNCSQLLAKSLKGEIVLLNSKPGTFAIQVSIPVSKVSFSRDKVNSSNVCLSPNQIKKYLNKDGDEEECIDNLINERKN